MIRITVVTEKNSNYSNLPAQAGNRSITMKIRLATKTDIADITLMKKIEDNDKYAQRINETTEGKSTYLVAELDGHVIGQVFLKYYGTKKYPEYPNMEDLFVDENFRNQGIGTALIRKCEDRVKEKRFIKIGLSVNPSLNKKAMGLYKKLGYVSLGNEPYLDGVYNGTEDWVIDLIKTL
jgi:GNAT superfamily N-acetyltransferase